LSKHSPTRRKTVRRKVNRPVVALSKPKSKWFPRDLKTRLLPQNEKLTKNLLPDRIKLKTFTQTNYACALLMVSGIRQHSDSHQFHKKSSPQELVRYNKSRTSFRQWDAIAIVEG
jgi:hypothetical protein